MHGRGKQIALICADILTAALAVGAWFTMMLGAGRGRLLTAVGLYALRYFTVDSNLLAAAASLICAAASVRAMRSGGKVPAGLQILRLAGAASTGVTFMTVMCFLGPVFGFASMFAGPNLVMHLIVPVLAAALFIAGRCGEDIPKRKIVIGAVPVLIYGTFYALNIIINGRGSGPTTNDWYGLAQWGPAMYAPVIAIITGMGLALSFLYWKGGGGRSKDR